MINGNDSSAPTARLKNKKRMLREEARLQLPSERSAEVAKPARAPGREALRPRKTASLSPTPASAPTSVFSGIASACRLRVCAYSRLSECQLHHRFQIDFSQSRTTSFVFLLQRFCFKLTSATSSSCLFLKHDRKYIVFSRNRITNRANFVLLSCSLSSGRGT